MTDLSQVSTEDLISMLSVHSGQQFKGNPASNRVTEFQKPFTRPLQQVVNPSASNQDQISENGQGQTLPQKMYEYFSNKPNTTYGSILPFSKNLATGQTNIDFPEPVRSLGRGVAEMMSASAGELPVSMMGGSLSEDALGVVGSMSPLARMNKLHSAPVPEGYQPIGNKAVQAVQKTAQKSVANIKEHNAVRHTPIQTSQQIKEGAQAFYDIAEAKGGKLNPSFTDRFIDEVHAMKPQTEWGKTVAGENELTKLSDKLEKGRGKPITLKDAQEIDEGLSDIIDSHYGVKGISKEGKKIQDVQRRFRDMIENPKEGDLEGGREGFDAWRKAQAEWSRSRRMNDIERIIAKAEHADVPATALKNGFKALINNDKNLRGFTTAEKMAIKNAARTGVLTGALKIAGSRLVPIIAGGGGVATLNPAGMAAGAAAAGASYLARKGATSIQMDKAKQIQRLISRRGQQ